MGIPTVRYLYWKQLKGQWKRRQLRCVHCDNILFTLYWEPVKRQERSLTASHMRVIAKCPSCKTSMRLKTGSPDNYEGR